MSERDKGTGQWQRWEMNNLERRTARTSAQHSKEASAAHDDTSSTGAGQPTGPQRRREDKQRRDAFEKARREGYEKGQQEGHEAGYAAGLEQGRAQAHEEYQHQLSQRLEQELEPMTRLVQSFDSAADRLSEDIAYSLVELALETGRQLAGRALELAPEHILDDIEKLMNEHPTLNGSPRICIHPDDLVMVQEQLGDLLGDMGWRLSSDSNMARGDCRLETDQREIDATREDRWERLRHAVGHGKH
ncbi:flagellar assembly protein FliH [Kushneria aurantia]|uniref:Flagellar assembly protein FliH n=1 Tax=Kushneria aurantia TaxID=504092 RepID=A0ABV6G0X6_9GAMM|nr:flagellar assembly protein FliH [Kushneria aurantia]